jgi:hypothetical protein
LYYLAAAVVVALCWWVSPSLGIAIAILLSGRCRNFVVPNAAFWTTGPVLTVGIALGLVMAVGIQLAANATRVSTIVKILLLIEGIFAVGYVGYNPAPEDRMMSNKAGQTATVGIVSYVLANIMMFFIPQK